jgi:DNA replication protein DnaC
MEMMPRYSDLTTQEQRGGARRCRCRVEADRAEARRQALAVIPREFGVPRLHLIAPDAKRYAQQFAKLEMLRSDPDRSYLICGRNGTGKSFFGWALYVHAIEQGRRAAACTLYELLKEYRRYTCQPAQNDWRPRVLPEDLKQNDTRWTIFLDEIHAATPSEFATREFFYLLKAATEYGHQMIYTCNVKPEVLHQRWSSVNEFEGDSIARRLAEYSKRIEMF